MYTEASRQEEEKWPGGQREEQSSRRRKIRRRRRTRGDCARQVPSKYIECARGHRPNPELNMRKQQSLDGNRLGHSAGRSRQIGRVSTRSYEIPHPTTAVASTRPRFLPLRPPNGLSVTAYMELGNRCKHSIGSSSFFRMRTFSFSPRPFLFHLNAKDVLLYRNNCILI